MSFIGEIGVRLGGDNSNFRSMLNDSVKQGGQFAGDIAGKVGGKLFELRDVSTAVATALGINLTGIAEKIARTFTGISKSEEEAFKNLEKVSDQLTETTIKNMRATLTEEQRYQLNLQERERLINQIADAETKTAVQIVAQKQAELKLAETASEIQKHELKLLDERKKKFEDATKAQIASNEKQFQAQLAILSSDEKIEALKENIAAMQAVIVSGVLSQTNAEQLSATLSERKNQFVAEEAKMKKEIADIDQKNADAVLSSQRRTDEAQRDQLSLLDQKKSLTKEIKELEDVVMAGWEHSRDVTKEVKLLDEARVKLRDVEKQQQAANVEIAKLMLKGSENLTAEEKLRLQLLQGQTTQKKIDEEITRLTAAAIAGTLTPSEKERLAVLVGQSDEIAKQLAGMGNLNKEVKAFIQTIGRSGTSYEGQSIASLEGVRDRVKAQLDRVKQENAMSPRGQRNPFEFSLQSEFDQVTREINMRKNIGDFANRFGEDAARGKFGDTLTDRALRSMQDDATKTRIALEDIQQRLTASGLFGKK